MIRILRVFTTFSIIIFLIVLLIVYSFLADPVGIMFSNNGEFIYTISRNVFFYSLVGIFFLVQLIFYLFRTYVLNNWLINPDRQSLDIWFRGMFLIVNIFFILLLIFLGLANNAINYTYQSIVKLAMAGPVLMILWLLLLPVFYFRSIQKRGD